MSKSNQSWVTVSEAILLCVGLGLERTPKTIRGWARNGHVEAQKKSTSNGEMWIIERASLETKIKTEIEYRDQVRAQAQTSLDPSEPVRTSTNSYEHSLTLGKNEHRKEQRSHSYRESTSPEPMQTQPNASERALIRDLETEIGQLKIDVGWRSKMIEKLTAENEKGTETLHAQARYIGHLESEMLRLGGTPDQTFLKAPKPHSDAHTAYENGSTEVAPEIVSGSPPHPHHKPLYGNDLHS